MRIALFHNLPSGGGKRTVYEQTVRLVGKHQIDLFSLSTADQEFTDIRAFVGKTNIIPFKPGHLFGSPFGRLNQGVRLMDLLRLGLVMRHLAQEIDQGDFDLALIHPCMFTFSPTILRYMDTPSLYYRHDPVRWMHDPLIPRPYRHSNRWSASLDRVDPLRRSYYSMLENEDRTSMLAATKVITNSYFNRESLYRIYGVAPYVSYHGVDIQLFRPLGLERQPYVISVGAVRPDKGYDFLIQSLAYVPQKDRPRLILVGNTSLGPEIRYLLSLAEQLGVQVKFHELITDDKLVRLYNQALCTVYAPVMEPFGLVPLESMACATPVIGICEGGVRETVVDGVTGYLEQRDPEQFARAILRLVEDQQLSERLGQQGRDFVEKQWTWERAIQSLEEHMEATVDHARRT